MIEAWWVWRLRPEGLAGAEYTKKPKLHLDLLTKNPKPQTEKDVHGKVWADILIVMEGIVMEGIITPRYSSELYQSDYVREINNLTYWREAGDADG